jgi:hypothetical protein
MDYFPIQDNLTFSTCGCIDNQCANSKALSTVRCTRNDNVSNPWISWNALNGLNEGPKSLNPSTRARMANAILGKPKGFLHQIYQKKPGHDILQMVLKIEEIYHCPSYNFHRQQ